jgi:hypothetical protein
MPKRIEFDGVVHEFPDDFSDADIAAALSVEAPKQEKSVGGFLENVGSSAVDAVKGIANTVMHPIETLKAADAGKQQWEQEGISELQQPPSGPSGLQRIGQQAQQMGDEAYRNPVGTAMAFAPAARPGVSFRPIQAGLERTGTRLMRGAVKPATGEINKMQGAAKMGLDAKSDQIAQVALKENVNPMTRGGLETIQQRIDALDSVRDADIAGAAQVPVQGSGFRQLSSLRPVSQRYKVQSTPDADVQSVVGLGKEMARNPALTKPTGKGMRDLTPNELNALNKGDNKALSGKMGKINDAEIDARKAVTGSRRADMEAVAPGTKETGRRMSDLINLRNVSNVARKRGEGRDGLGLTDLVTLSSGRPETFLLSTAMRPAVQAGIGKGLYNTGQALPPGIEFTDLYRLALIAQLANGDK